MKTPKTTIYLNLKAKKFYDKLSYQKRLSLSTITQIICDLYIPIANNNDYIEKYLYTGTKTTIKPKLLLIQNLNKKEGKALKSKYYSNILNSYAINKEKLNNDLKKELIKIKKEETTNEDIEKYIKKVESTIQKKLDTTREEYYNLNQLIRQQARINALLKK